jgi:putative ABC transport system permease protein
VTTSRLVWRNLMRHPARSVLTFLFAALALFLFVFLRSILTTLESAVTGAASNRLATQSAVSLFVHLPEAYRQRIAGLEGVESVGPWTWFGAWHKDESEFFAQFAVDLEVLLDQYPEVVIVEGDRAALLSDRQGALVGADLARQFGWKVGDRVPLTSRIYERPSGGAWEFDVRAIYRSTKPNIDEKTMFFHDEYFQEVRRALAERGAEAGVNVYMVKVAPGRRAEDVAAAIDAVYDNGPQRTRTQTEAAFQAQFVSMMGNLPVFLGLIGGAVLFAIFFSVLNTSQMAARERASDVGILKALGFRDALAGRLLLAESMLLVGLGGVVGIAAALGTEAFFRRTFGTQIPNYFVEWGTVALGLAVAVTIGLLGGVFPARRLVRLRPVEVFREEG